MGTYDSFATPEQFGTNSDPAKDATSATAESQPSEVCHVGEVRLVHSAGPRLTDEAREAAIERAGVLIYRYMGIWERTGDFGARGDADRARRLMEQLIAGRSAEYIAKLERERGLDLPACANDARSA